MDELPFQFPDQQPDREPCLQGESALTCTGEEQKLPGAAFPYPFAGVWHPPCGC